MTLTPAPPQVSRRLLSKPQDALEGVVLSVSGRAGQRGRGHCLASPPWDQLPLGAWEGQTGWAGSVPLTSCSSPGSPAWRPECGTSP